jgi:hypothetical protein
MRDQMRREKVRAASSNQSRSAPLTSPYGVSFETPQNFAKVTKSKICRQNRYVMVHSHAAKVRFLIARSTPWCIPGFIASTVVCCRTAPHHPPECGRRRQGCASAVGRASHCACFQRARCRRPVQFRPMGTVGPPSRLCANRKCRRDCDDERSPHFSFPRVFTVENSLDGKSAR